jgi:hypothetical protein
MQNVSTPGVGMNLARTFKAGRGQLIGCPAVTHGWRSSLGIKNKTAHSLFQTVVRVKRLLGYEKNVIHKITRSKTKF